MKDYVLELAASKSDPNDKLNFMREYLQSYILKIMQDMGAFRFSAFVGGTALRFLYDLPRFSEDLDFSLEGTRTKTFVEMITRIKTELELAGYKVNISYKDQKTVQAAMIKFQELLFAAGLAGLKDQNVSVKLEIDTNPPQGAGTVTRVVNKYFPLSFLSYDLESMLAGKMNALLARKYSKGRDFYDICWYLSRFKDLKPNMTLLRNGLEQAGWDKEYPTEDNWRDYIYKVVEAVDWKAISDDVRNFLERPSDMDTFSRKNVLEMIKDPFR